MFREFTGELLREHLLHRPGTVVGDKDTEETLREPGLVLPVQGGR